MLAALRKTKMSKNSVFTYLGRASTVLVANMAYVERRECTSQSQAIKASTRIRANQSGHRHAPSERHVQSMRPDWSSVYNPM